MSGGRVEKNLECAICLNYFNQPKQLPCHDTFCLNCLKDYCSGVIAGNKKDCPLCRQEFIVPEGGAEMLRDNQVLMRLGLEKGSRKRKQQLSRCEACVEGAEPKDARYFCMECKQCLCVSCRQIHSKMNSSKQHKVVNMEDKPSTEDLTRMQSAYCDKHNGDELKLYCCECCELLCYSCHATQHYKHRCMTSLEAAQARKDSLQKDYDDLVRYRDNERVEHKNQLVRKDKFLNDITETKNSIESHFEKLSQVINTRRSDLLKTLDEIRKENEKDFQNQEDEASSNIFELDNFLKYSGMVMDRGTDCDVIRVADELQRKAKELIKSQEEQTKQYQQEISVTFEASTDKSIQDIKKVLELDNIKEFRQTNAEPELCETKDVKVIKYGPGIRGITVVDDYLYIVKYDQPFISIYDLKTSDFHPRISVPGMKIPIDLAGCSLNKLLYVSDRNLKCIHRVSLADKSVYRFNLKNNFKPCGLSVTMQHNLLITCESAGDGDYKHCVAEFSTKGQLIRSIYFDKSIKSAWKTVQLSTSQFVVCHGPSLSSLNTLSCINSNGQIVKSYGRGKGQDKLNHIVSLAVDRDKGVVHVVDNRNGQIWVFNKDLTLVKCTEKLEHPTHIYVEYSSGSSERLYIVKGSDITIAVIKSA